MIDRFHDGGGRFRIDNTPRAPKEVRCNTRFKYRHDGGCSRGLSWMESLRVREQWCGCARWGRVGELRHRVAPGTHRGGVGFAPAEAVLPKALEHLFRARNRLRKARDGYTALTRSLRSTRRSRRVQAPAHTQQERRCRGSRSPRVSFDPRRRVSAALPERSSWRWNGRPELRMTLDVRGRRTATGLRCADTHDGQTLTSGRSP